MEIKNEREEKTSKGNLITFDNVMVYAGETYVVTSISPSIVRNVKTETGIRAYSQLELISIYNLFKHINLRYNSEGKIANLGEVILGMEGYADELNAGMFSALDKLIYKVGEDTISKHYPESFRPWLPFKIKKEKGDDERVYDSDVPYNIITKEIDKMYVNKIGDILTEITYFLEDKPNNKEFNLKREEFKKRLSDIVRFAEKDQALPDLKGHYLVSPHKFHMDILTYTKIMNRGARNILDNYTAGTNNECTNKTSYQNESKFFDVLELEGELEDE